MPARRQNYELQGSEKGQEPAPTTTNERKNQKPLAQKQILPMTTSRKNVTNHLFWILTISGRFFGFLPGFRGFLQVFVTFRFCVV